MGPSTKATLKMASDTDLELKFGQMARNTKESGNSTKPMEKANSGMQTATFMKVCGKMTRRMAMEFTYT